VSGWERVVNVLEPATLGAGQETVRFVSCPAGKRVLGGGFVVFAAVGRWVSTSNGPTSNTQWAVALWNSSAVPITAARVEAWAICATVL